MSNLSNIMSTNTSTSFQNSQNVNVAITATAGATATSVSGVNTAPTSGNEGSIIIHSQPHGVPLTSSSHHSANPHDRINHSSPNKGPGSASIGIAGSLNANTASINMVGSQAGSIQ